MSSDKMMQEYRESKLTLEIFLDFSFFFPLKESGLIFIHWDSGKAVRKAEQRKF